MTDTRTKIMDLAEKLIRTRGYHAVSFRDLADELGIKSASIHYHFRHKEDLGRAVVDRYAERVGATLGPAGELDWPGALERFFALYRDALNDGDLQCLCGILAAESFGLPDDVAGGVGSFFKANIDWLMASVPSDVGDKRALALEVQSEVQGAMIVSVGMRDPSILDRLAEQRLAKA